MGGGPSCPRPICRRAELTCPASLTRPLPPPQALGEPLYRVSTGNYEYRLILRCRQEARARFSQMRKDVLEKMELLDQKHGEGLGGTLGRRVTAHPSESTHRPWYGGVGTVSPLQSWEIGGPEGKSTYLGPGPGRDMQCTQWDPRQSPGESVPAHQSLA